MATAEAGMPFRRKGVARTGYFPEEGDVPHLVRTSKVLTYKGEKFQEFYGSLGNRYIQYGLLNMMSAEYTYGGREGRMTIEMSTMENPVAAAGLFHYHRGDLLQAEGQMVDVGTEGVLDTGRGGRNLYFYRSNLFVKIVYSGKEPVPDITVIGKFIDSQMPAGKDARPEGFSYIEVDGVNTGTIALTPGFTFNISFLPPAVFASAPGAGSVASDLYIITRNLDRDAAQLHKDYTAYLKLFAEYVEEYRRDGQAYTKAVDPNQGRVVCTQYRNAFIIMARPDGYEKGEVMIDRVMAKIDELSPPVDRRGGLFGRRKRGGRDGVADKADAAEE
ncbi:MAG: hypothetical protein LIP77_06580 [Planctomycetes bacterium]|nr:hypothetical protein [Planctomycetota bacterium]